MCYCLGWPVKDVQYEAAPKYRNTTTGYRYQWNGQSWDLQEIQVPTVSSYGPSFCLNTYKQLLRGCFNDSFPR